MLTVGGHLENHLTEKQSRQRTGQQPCAGELARRLPAPRPVEPAAGRSRGGFFVSAAGGGYAGQHDAARWIHRSPACKQRLRGRATPRDSVPTGHQGQAWRTCLGDKLVAASRQHWYWEPRAVGDGCAPHPGAAWLAGIDDAPCPVRHEASVHDSAPYHCCRW